MQTFAMNHRRLAIALAMMVAFLSSVTGAVFAGGAGGAGGAEEAGPAEIVQTFELPLHDGRLSLNALVGTMLDYVGIDGRLLSGFMDTSVDVSGATGRLTMKTIAFATRGVMSMDIQGQGPSRKLVLQVDRLALREKRAVAQRRIMRLIEAWEPQAAAKMQRNIGWFLHAPDAKPAPVGETKITADAGKTIVLIHGLDEPGWCWNTIAPALVKQGYTVCELRYPNDQAIAKSARFFAERLIELRQAGAKDVSILAHSMGGLVARETLTNADYYAGKGDGGEHYPKVNRLIMLGPPNHGSAAAELQLLGEVREQVVRLFTGDGHLFGAFFDGSGEAKDDLLPGSPFLKSLNARPLPSGVKITILASQISPVNEKQIEAMRVKLRGKAPAEVAWGPDRIAAAVASVAQGLGDGAVPVASTKLEGVTDHIMVPGNHSSMLHKKEGETTALAIILKRLAE